MQSQVTRYNNLAQWYSQFAADVRVHDDASQRSHDDYLALSEAASNVANLYAQGYSWAKSQLPVLASQASNGRVRSFYQTAITELGK